MPPVDAGGLALADERALTGLVVEWAWCLDHDAAEGILELVTGDAVIDLFGGPMTRVQLRTWVQERGRRPERRTHHQLSNVRLRRTADGATGHVQLVLRTVDADAPEAHVTFTGEYLDAYARTAGGWRIRRRTLLALGQEVGT